MGFMDRVKRSWDVFRNGESSVPEADLITMFHNSMQSVWRDSTSKVLAPIVNRISIDVCSVPIRHVFVDEYRRFVKFVPNSELDDRLYTRANIDQTGAELIKDAAHTLLTTGACVFVAVETPDRTSLTPLQLRVGNVVDWRNRSVVVSLYNEHTGKRQDITLSKHDVAIVANPLYTVMNETNSTARRLIDKLALLDISDKRATMPGLDLVLKFPYAMKTDKQTEEAKRRVRLLEEQLYDSRYGIGYVGATEDVIQLNRPVENRLQEQVDDLRRNLHNQLGLTENVFNGTASQEEMLTYYGIARDPILKAITDALSTTFLTRTAISQKQWVLPIPTIFKMAPLEVIADAADKLTRNEIMSSNEVRGVVGLAPVDTPEANELRNKNLNKSDGQIKESSEQGGIYDPNNKQPGQS